MMSKKKSNSRARWKLLLLLPVAALSMYAFARPDVTRQLEQIIRSEDTTIPSNDQIYTPEFFDAELNRYIIEQGGSASLSVSEKADFLAKRTNCVRLLINAEDNVLLGVPDKNTNVSFQIQITKSLAFERIPVELSKALLTDYPNKKPVLICLIYDRGTSSEMVAKIYQIVGKVFADNETLLKQKEQPVLLFYEEPQTYHGKQISGSGSPADTEKPQIDISVLDETGKALLAFIIELKDKNSLDTGTSGELNKALNYLIKDGYQNCTVLIKVSPNERMGVINDIKEILRNHYELISMTFMAQKLTFGDSIVIQSWPKLQ